MSKTKTGARSAQPQDRRVCKRCEHTKPIELFKKSGAGRGHTCKVCDARRASDRWHADPEAPRAKRRARRQRNLVKERAQAKARYWANPDKHRAQSRERARSERGRASNRKAVARYRRAHPQVVAAHKAAQRAVTRGELKRPSVCEVRGCACRDDLAMHHNRYDAKHVLKVTTVCRGHHTAIHRRGQILPLKTTSARKWVRPPQRHEVRP